MKRIKKTKEKEICEICGKELGKEETNEFGGKILCKHCLDNETRICEVCHTRIWNNDDYGDDYTSLCRNCYNEHYTRCERCNDLIHRDDANYFGGCDSPYCNECFDELEENSAIHDYSYKPELIFYGNEKLYFGVELEIDCGGEINDNDNADAISFQFCSINIYMIEVNFFFIKNICINVVKNIFYTV